MDFHKGFTKLKVLYQKQLISLISASSAAPLAAPFAAQLEAMFPHQTRAIPKQVKEIHLEKPGQPGSARGQISKL
jgi:hypothetical protein